MAIRVRNLSVSYGTLQVLRDLNFEVGAQEIVSLLGPSGCGKSTLLRVLAGLIKPDLGDVTLGARTGAPARTGARVGLMFQKPLLMPWRTTLENVLLPVEIALGGSKVGAVDIARARQILSMVGLSAFEGSRPHQLSGGMQQRASLARALISDPELLLLDEPFGALDELTRETLNEELLRIWQNPETRLKTIVMVTHSISEAVALSDRVFVFASRPARLTHTVDVRLSHPRARDSAGYTRIVAQVRSLVRATS